MRVNVKHLNVDTIIAACADGPVHVESDGVELAVVLSPERYAELAASAHRAMVERLFAQSIATHGQLYKALAAWEAKNEPPDQSGS